MSFRYGTAALIVLALLSYSFWIRPMSSKPDYQTVFDSPMPPSTRLKWSVVKKGVRWKFPRVAQISTDSLAALLSRSDKAPLVLDVRGVDEYEISHLNGASRALSVEEALPALQNMSVDRDVVLYHWFLPSPFKKNFF